MLGEKYDRPGAKRGRLVPTVLSIPIFGSLVKEDGRNSKPVIRLQNQLFRDQELRRTIGKLAWIRNRHAVPKVAKIAGSNLWVPSTCRNNLCVRHPRTAAENTAINDGGHGPKNPNSDARHGETDARSPSLFSTCFALTGESRRVCGDRRWFLESG